MKELSQRLALSLLVVAGLLCFTTITTLAQANHKNHPPPISNTVSGLSKSDTQEWAKQRLTKSPRRQEWVKVKNGDREIECFIVYPKVKNKATAVVVIHEILGMTDWVQSLTDQLAEAGYIAIAPDMLSGVGPNGGGTKSLGERDAIVQAIRDLRPRQITADLNAVVDYVSKLPAANGKVAVSGFCWGGSQAFRYATINPTISAAFVFYGEAPRSSNQPDKAALEKIKTRVYGFYGENDARINVTVPPTQEMMRELNKFFDPVTYRGSGHGFMSAGEAPKPQAPQPKGEKAADNKAAEDYQKAIASHKANQKARHEAWVRWRRILAKL